jgi:hypothetical protein
MFQHAFHFAWHPGHQKNMGSIVRDMLAAGRAPVVQQRIGAFQHMRLFTVDQRDRFHRPFPLRGHVRQCFFIDENTFFDNFSQAFPRQIVVGRTQSTGHDDHIRPGHRQPERRRHIGQPVTDHLLVAN